MAKRKTPKKTGVKSLKMSLLLSYAVAGMGVVFIVALILYLFAAWSPEKEDPSPGDKGKWASAAGSFAKSGVLLGFEKDREKESEGSALVDEKSWDKLPYDSREALCVAVTESLDVKTLQVREPGGKTLGVFRRGGRLFENR